MIYYSAFLMDSETRRLLLFFRDRNRLWQTAHTSYRKAPTNQDENDAGVQEAFQSAFTLPPELEIPPRVITGTTFSLTIVSTTNIRTHFSYGQIMPWDVDETLKLNLDTRTRRSIKANIGLLMYFADVDHDVWCNMKDFAHAPSR